MKSTSSKRPDRKVTDFFTRKPKTGPRPDQPVYDISSSSERQSVISISSDEVRPPSKVPQAISGASSSSNVGVPRSFQRQRSTRSAAAMIVPSSSQPAATRSAAEDVTSSSSAPPTKRTGSRSHEAQAASKPPSKKPATTNTNSKKRKQPPISLITSEESDGPVFPSIHVKPSSKKSLSSAPKSHFHASIQAVFASSQASVPLAPRQNIQSSSNTPSRKPSTAATPTTPAKTSGSVSQAAKAVTPKQHHPSPPKRARYETTPGSQKCMSTVPNWDADDENEHEIHTPLTASGKTTLSSQGDDIKPQMADRPVDVGAPISSSPRVASAPDSDADDERDSQIKSPRQQSAWKTTPRTDAHEIVPSSQDDETELGMEIETTSAFTHVPTPSKSRADDIIARIKAKAEADAAAQAQDEQRRSSLGLLTDGSVSDMSSLSSSSSADEFEDKLDELRKRNIPSRLTKSPLPVDSRSRTDSETPSAAGARRSTRHSDVPAPNYAKRLELFRDDTPPPSGEKRKRSVDDKSKGKGKARAELTCPLDMLLKDHEREDARRTKAETKRQAHTLAMRASSPGPATGSSPMVDRHSGIFETPRRRRSMATESPGSDVSSVRDGDGFGEDALMGDAEREELLGKEDAEAVGKILRGDREKRGKKDNKKEEGGIAFWDANTEGGEDVVPELVVTEQSTPLLQSLRNAIKRGDFAMASLLLDSGAPSVPLSVDFLKWLFSTAVSTVHPGLSKSAYRSILVSHRAPSPEQGVIRAELSSETFVPALLRLGVNLQIAELLRGCAGEEAPIVSATQELKVETVCRFIAILGSLGSARAVDPAAVPAAVLALLLLSLDSSAVHKLQQDVVSAIEKILTSTSNRTVELRVCKSIIHATTSLSFTPLHNSQLLALLSGCSASSGRVRRWVAWAMFGGDLESVQECGDVPPLDVLANLFAEDADDTIRLDVNRDTDYDVLGSRVDVLSVALTDVDSYVRQEWAARGGTSGGLENICKALEHMNGKIVDTRAAHLDRTRTKDAINRLHKRLVYQRHATLEIIRGNAGKLDGFVTKTTAKSKPKPIKSHAGILK